MGATRFHPVPKAIRQTLVVRHAGVLEVQSPELLPGAVADVIVILESEVAAAPRPLAEVIGAAQGLFPTPEEADEFLRREREEWNS